MPAFLPDYADLNRHGVTGASVRTIKPDQLINELLKLQWTPSLPLTFHLSSPFFQLFLLKTTAARFSFTLNQKQDKCSTDLFYTSRSTLIDLIQSGLRFLQQKAWRSEFNFRKYIQRSDDAAKQQ